MTYVTCPYCSGDGCAYCDGDGLLCTTCKGSHLVLDADGYGTDCPDCS